MNTTKGIFSHKSDEWETPQNIFEQYNRQFHFTVDDASTHENAKCVKHYTKEDNGLLKSWENERVWCNPPYSNIEAWLRKAINEKALSVFLLPSRTDTKWFHECVLSVPCRVTFLRGRLKFSNSKNGAPFGSIIVIYDNFHIAKKRIDASITQTTIFDFLGEEGAENEND